MHQPYLALSLILIIAGTYLYIFLNLSQEQEIEEPDTNVEQIYRKSFYKDGRLAARSVRIGLESLDQTYFRNGKLAQQTYIGPDDQVETLCFRLDGKRYSSKTSPNEEYLACNIEL